MLNELWRVANHWDDQKHSTAWRDHILRVLREEVNNGKGIRVDVKAPDKDADEKHDVLSWHQGCGLTADKILEHHKSLCSWNEEDDAELFKLHSDMWKSYVVFNVLQQKAHGVTDAEARLCGILGREALARASLCLQGRICVYQHVQVSTLPALQKSIRRHQKHIA
jgi:hypothetical protein